MAFDIRHIDTECTPQRTDWKDKILCRYNRFFRGNNDTKAIDNNNIFVALRLSLMKTLFERKGYLDLPFIDNVIRQVIRDFKNKHQTQIKKEHWAILADMCWQEIDRQARVEPEEETDPVDIDICDDDIDAWINSEL